jgi:DNA-3-methyladenine glycosylase
MSAWSSLIVCAVSMGAGESSTAREPWRELPQPIVPLPRHTVPRDTVALARFLLGKVVVRQFRGALAAGRIVETEAYLQHDPACHGFRGITERNRSLFLDHGHAYVYLCYGTSYLLNVSSETDGIGTGVLLRALEPIHGIEHMLRWRGTAVPQGRLSDLARGPGRLTAALRVDRRHDGLDLFEPGQLWIGSDGHTVDTIGVSVRIGITKAAEEKLRFYVAGSGHLSGKRSLNR